MSTGSYNTAIARKNPSSPLVTLERLGLIHGTLLDYGCGKGADGRYLQSKNIEVDSYDPHWSPISLEGKVYDTILCTYVLNVIESDQERDFLVKDILKHLKPKGKAYLSVRRDLKKEGKTSRGFQKNITLNYPVVKEKRNNFCIYELSLI